MGGQRRYALSYPHSGPTQHKQGLQHEDGQPLPSRYPQDLSDDTAWLPVSIAADSWGLSFPEAMLQVRGWGTGAWKVK